ncbi:MAG: hypothetical protein ACOCZ5_01060 [bacterium]
MNEIAHWDEHSLIQVVINNLLSRLTLNPIFFLLSGIIQHLTIDNIINERPVNIFSDNKNKEILSLLLNILGLLIAIFYNYHWYFLVGLLGALLPDILEGLRLLFSGDGENLWMNGDSSSFHIKLTNNYLLDTRYNYKADLFRRIILILAVVFYIISI